MASIFSKVKLKIRVELIKSTATKAPRGNSRSSTQLAARRTHPGSRSSTRQAKDVAKESSQKPTPYPAKAAFVISGSSAWRCSTSSHPKRKPARTSTAAAAIVFHRLARRRMPKVFSLFKAGLCPSGDCPAFFTSFPIAF